MGRERVGERGKKEERRIESEKGGERERERKKVERWSRKEKQR